MTQAFYETRAEHAIYGIRATVLFINNEPRTKTQRSILIKILCVFLETQSNIFV